MLLCLDNFNHKILVPYTNFEHIFPYPPCTLNSFSPPKHIFTQFDIHTTIHNALCVICIYMLYNINMDRAIYVCIMYTCICFKIALPFASHMIGR